MTGYRVSDALWELLKPLIPPHEPKPHPLGCHRPRIPDRQVADAIFFVLRTGCQWQALDATGICNHSIAHKRFQEWRDAGVFLKLWQQSLEGYDCLIGLDWNWLCGDGVITKAPLGGEKNRAQPRRPGQARHQTLAAH
jgi:transposase